VIGIAHAPSADVDIHDSILSISCLRHVLSERMVYFSRKWVPKTRII
jgi:hypothetical protein